MNRYSSHKNIKNPGFDTTKIDEEFQTSKARSETENDADLANRKMSPIKSDTSFGVLKGKLAFFILIRFYIII